MFEELEVAKREGIRDLDNYTREKMLFLWKRMSECDRAEKLKWEDKGIWIASFLHPSGGVIIS